MTKIYGGLPKPISIVKHKTAGPPCFFTSISQLFAHSFMFAAAVALIFHMILVLVQVGSLCRIRVGFDKGRC